MSTDSVLEVITDANLNIGFKDVLVNTSGGGYTLLLPPITTNGMRINLVKSDDFNTAFVVGSSLNLTHDQPYLPLVSYDNQWLNIYDINGATGDVGSMGVTGTTGEAGSVSTYGFTQSGFINIPENSNFMIVRLWGSGGNGGTGGNGPLREGGGAGGYLAYRGELPIGNTIDFQVGQGGSQIDTTTTFYVSGITLTLTAYAGTSPVFDGFNFFPGAGGGYVASPPPDTSFNYLLSGLTGTNGSTANGVTGGNGGDQYYGGTGGVGFYPGSGSILPQGQFPSGGGGGGPFSNLINPPGGSGADGYITFTFI